MTKKRASVKGMTLENILNDVRKEQTVHGKKYNYAPIVLTIHPALYPKLIFRLKDIDAFIRLAPRLPSGKVKIQICDDPQKPVLVPMNRRKALFKLLNQAVGNYKYGKEQPTIETPASQVKQLQKVISSTKRSIQDAVEHLYSNKTDAEVHVLSSLQDVDAPLKEAQANLASTLKCCDLLESNWIEAQKRIQAQSTKKSSNTGDGWYRNLMDDLCKIWIVVFQNDVGIWPTTHEGKSVLGGLMLPFIKAVLKAAGIEKSDESARKAVDLWRKRHMVK